MEQKRNHDAVLVTLADRNFIDQAKQLFSSVYWNAGWRGDYMLLAHEIPEKELKWFRDKGILVKKCKPLKQSIIDGTYHPHPPIVLDKLYLFLPEFKKWKKIIFLDADIIVRASLDKLTRVKGFCVAEDFLGNPLLKGQFTLENNKKITINDIELNMKDRAFNSGVIAFSTDIIKEDTFPKLKNLISKYVKISNGDQSILNIFFYKKWKKLPQVYNIFPCSLLSCGFKLNQIKGICLHFVILKSKNSKAWDLKNPFYKEWKENLDKSYLIDLSNRHKGKKWRNFDIIKESFLFSNYKPYHKYCDTYYRIKCFAEKLYSNISFSIREFFIKLKNFVYYKILKKILNLPLAFLGITGQSIKRISPSLYYTLKGKNGKRTKKKS